jgi:hypothetical protein
MKFIIHIHYENNAPEINENNYKKVYENARKKLLNRGGGGDGSDLIQFKKVDIYKKRLAYYTKQDEIEFTEKTGDVKEEALKIVKSIIILCKEPNSDKKNHNISGDTQTFLETFSGKNKSIKYEFKNKKLCKLCEKSVDASDPSFNAHFENYINNEKLHKTISSNPGHEVKIHNYGMMVQDKLAIALQQFTEHEFKSTKHKKAITDLMEAHRKAVQTKKNNNDDTNIGNYEFNEGDILDFAYNSNLDLDTNKVYVYVCQDDNDKDKDKDNDKAKEKKQTKFRSFISSLEKYRTHWEPETDGKTFISTAIAFLISKSVKGEVTYDVIIPDNQADFQMNFGPSTKGK